ncbi:MAG: pectate lyase [Hamadaea sp.]|nr:pectate lyase [Hamadaea sp.]
MRISRWRAALAVGATTTVLLATVLIGQAQAATLFSDDFTDGDASGWSTSGGSWSVAAGAYRQTGTGTDAKAQAGNTAWANQTVQARVRADAFGTGSGRFAGVLARAQNMTNYYYLALSSGQAVLGKRVSGGYATLATASRTVTTGTWYTLRLEAFGGTVRGFVDGVQLFSVSDGSLATGRIGVTTVSAAASFDDVVVTDVAGPGPSISPSTPGSPPASPSASASASRSPSASPSPSTPPSPSTSPTPPRPNVADGFASVSAWGQSGTSGGAGGATVRVSTASAFLAAIAQSGPLVIEVSGMISLPGPMHDVTSDKSVIGVGASSGLTGGGLNVGLPLDDDITSPPANAVRNVIIRNLTITNCPDDCINVQMFSHHVWIDHNDLSNQVDGALDVKRGSSYVTISWNRFHDSDKNMLLGHDDSNGAQDVGRLKVTYHHNFFDGSNQRNPRVRFGEPVHIYNNYYLHITGYGAASQMNAGLLVENNYFDDVEKPTRNDVGGTAGRIVARGNVNVNTEDPIVVSGSVEEASNYYAYTLDPAANVPAMVAAGAGVGKI